MVESNRSAAFASACCRHAKLALWLEFVQAGMILTMPASAAVPKTSTVTATHASMEAQSTRAHMYDDSCRLDPSSSSSSTSSSATRTWRRWFQRPGPRSSSFTMSCAKAASTARTSLTLRASFTMPPMMQTELLRDPRDSKLHAVHSRMNSK